MNVVFERFFFDQIVFQLVSGLFLVVLEFVYFTRRKLPFLSTGYFSGMMICSLLYIILDMVSAFSIVYIDKLPYHAVRVIHQLDIIALNTILLFIYLYVDIFNTEDKKVSKLEIAFAIIIYIGSIIFVAISSIYYCRTATGVYSYGPMTISSYVISIIYIVFTMGKSLKVSIQSYFHPKQKYIFTAMGILVVFMILKIFFPALRITSVGISLMMFTMFLSFESSKDYINRETGAFRTEALKMMLVEKIHKNNKFYILNIDFEDLVEVERTLGEEAVTFLLNNVVLYLHKQMKIPIYSISDYGLTMIIDKRKISEEDLYTFINKVEDRFKSPWVIKNNKVTLNTHCDFIVYPEDCAGITTIGELLRFIWECHKFTDSDSFIRKVNKKMIDVKLRNKMILSMVQSAIENDGIEMYYQPIYSIPDGKFTNVEALVRLKDTTTLGFVSPEEFIPIVEKNGLIMELSNIIFEKIFQFLSESKIQERGVTHIELNLSAIQAIDTSLPTQMSYLMEKYGIDPKIINLEITETTMIESATLLNKNIIALTNMGCSFSMDDFGTGYSNLAQMAQIAYEYIKIDKTLIWPCFDNNNADKNNSTIVLETAVKMILNLRKEIIAEGVETEEQLNFLSAIGVNYIQGSFFSRPLNEKSYIEFLDKNNKD